MAQRILVIALLAMGGYLAYGFVTKQKVLLAKTRIRPTSIRIKDLRIRHVHLGVTLEADNYMEMNITVFHQRYAIYLNDRLLTTVTKPEKIVIPAGGSAKAELDLEFDPMEFISATIQETGLDLRSIRVSIRGGLVVGTGFLQVTRLPVRLDVSVGELIDKAKAEV